MAFPSVSSLVEKLLNQRQRSIAAQKVSLADGGLGEAGGLVRLCQVYQNERRFSAHPLHETFNKLLVLLKSYYITEAWLGGVALEEVELTHAILMTLRLLLRDEKFQHVFMKPPSPLLPLSQAFSHLLQVTFSSSHSDTYTPDLIKEITNIFQKLSNSPRYRGDLVEVGVHHDLVQLLHSSELTSLQCSLCALTNLCKSDHTCVSVAELNCAMALLTIMTTFDLVSRQLAADLLLLLSQHSSICDQIRNVDGLPVCLKLLHSDDLHLLTRSIGLLDHLTKSSSDVQDEVRLLGGIPLLLNILSKHSLSSISSSEVADKVLALKAVCCSTLAQLGLNDSNSQQIVQGNGVYLISTLVLPIATKEGVVPDPQLMESLQLHALRTLRYLFSMERHRRVFKRLFPPNLFAMFIDVGHYTYELSAYSQLVHAINNLPESERAVLQTNIEGTNQNRDALSTIGGYSILELLGSGAFGSVYKVHKVAQKEQLLALKEIRCSHAGLGRTAIEQSTNLGRLLNEVEIMREQLRHPNVVRYHKCFQEGGHLYIVMELVEGAPLIEHINSLQEKGQRFSEARLWSIFTQLVLALRYIHKEKHIVHRDLSPSNLMLGEGDHLTITDFGLAKQKQREFSVMQSVVGTMPYWCPELVENEPYTEKVDIWAAGCILYQMASLKPPFHSTNMLALAKKIVEVDYVKLPEGLYSSLVGGVIDRCLTSDPGRRPDSVELGSLIAPVMMQQMDKMAASVETLQARLDRERQRTIKHFHKAVWTEQKYRELLLSSSQESPSYQPHPPTRPLLSARRKLSTSFNSSVQFSSFPTPIAEGEAPGLLSNQRDERSRSPSRDLSPEGSVESEGVMGEAGDPLQRSSASDNVFVESDRHRASGSLTFQHQYPSNQSGLQTDSSISIEANMSPQVSRLRPHSHRPNPLISYTNGSRARSQSAVFAGREDSPFSLITNRSPLSRRATLALIGRSHHGGGSGLSFAGMGPLSPLTSGHKSRTASASSTLSISPRHLREISDPISLLLSQLHKLIFLTQLPPSHKPSARQTLVEQYKRFLFDGTSDPSNLKSELHKLSSGVSDIVQVLSKSEGSRMVEQCLKEMTQLSLGGDGYHVDSGVGGGGEGDITYEQLQAIIESLVVENGYYQTAT